MRDFSSKYFSMLALHPQKDCHYNAYCSTDSLAGPEYFYHTHNCTGRVKKVTPLKALNNIFAYAMLF